MTPGSMVFIYQVNLTILLVALASMLLLFGFAYTQRSLEALRFTTMPSTASAFWFFFVGCLCLFFLYVWYVVHAKQGATSDPVFDIGTDILGNTSNLCFLVAAIAYGRGNAFNPLHAVGAVILLAMFITIWAFGWSILSTQANAFVLAIQYAPELVLPSVTFLLLGWVFFARWGGIPGLLFLIVCLLYGILQVPANLYANFDTLLDPKSRVDLLTTFSFLGAGKILLVFGFLSLLCSSSITDIHMENSKFWPDRPVEPPLWFRQIGGWIVSLVASIATALITQFKCELLGHVLAKCS